jgi:hypothetical protein
MFSDTFKKVLGYAYFPTDPNRVEKYVHLEISILCTSVLCSPRATPSGYKLHLG